MLRNRLGLNRIRLQKPRKGPRSLLMRNRLGQNRIRKQKQIKGQPLRQGKRSTKGKLIEREWLKESLVSRDL